MINKSIKKFKDMTFEEKTEFNTFFSVCLNIIFSIGKSVITIITGSFMFLISASVNLCIGLAKIECYSGIKKKEKNKQFDKRNIKISFLFMIAGLMYILYMGRLILFDTRTFHYNMFLGINIAFISFVEMGFAIVGIIRVKQSGHFYRNIKIINFASACTAIMLTQVALLSFCEATNVNKVNGFTGVAIGLFMIILGIFIIILPKASMIDRKYNEYKYMVSKVNTINLINNFRNKMVICNDNHLTIIFSKSKVYGTYYFEATLLEDKISGTLNHKCYFFKELNIFLKILVIILSEILFFIWLIGRLISFIRNSFLPTKLDKIMKNFNCEYNQLNSDIIC